MHVKNKTYGQGMSDRSVWGKQNIVARKRRPTT